MSFTVDGIGEIGRAVSDSTGVATLSTRGAPVIGNYRLAATAVGSDISALATLVSHTGTPARIVLAASSPTTGIAGSDVIIGLSVLDAGGNVLSNQPIDRSTADGGSGHEVSDGAAIAEVW